MDLGDIAGALSSLFEGRSTLGVLVILSFILIAIDHFVSLGIVGVLAWAVFIICFGFYVAYNIFNLGRQ